SSESIQTKDNAARLRDEGMGANVDPAVVALANEIVRSLTYRLGKNASVATRYDWLSATIRVVRDRLVDKWIASTKKAYDRQDKRRSEERRVGKEGRSRRAQRDS